MHHPYCILFNMINISVNRRAEVTVVVLQPHYVHLSSTRSSLLRATQLIPVALTPSPGSHTGWTPTIMFPNVRTAYILGQCLTT
jgi:hypothetical protein